MLKNSLTLDINDLLNQFSPHAAFQEVGKWCTGAEKKLTLKGLEGSLCAILFSHLKLKSGKSIFITMDDEESAAYLYHDITQLIGDDSVFFYPSAYRRSNNEQKDAAN